VHTQHDSNESYKSGGTLWPHRPDVMITTVCVHIVAAVELHGVVTLGSTGEVESRFVLAMQPMLYSLATTEVERLEQRSANAS
jgi:hypothetical protein